MKKELISVLRIEIKILLKTFSDKKNIQSVKNVDNKC
jgi:hypothetical protein